MSAPLKLTPAQWRVLEWLREMDGPMDYWPCTTQLMQRLEENRLVISGARGLCGTYAITDAGRAALAEREAAK